MVDFSKLKPRTHYTYVTYKCERCGKVEEYVQEMPKGWRCYPVARKCRGLLVEVSRRTVTREERMR